MEGVHQHSQERMQWLGISGMVYARIRLLRSWGILFYGMLDYSLFLITTLAYLFFPWITDYLQPFSLSSVLFSFFTLIHQIPIVSYHFYLHPHILLLYFFISDLNHIIFYLLFFITRPPSITISLDHWTIVPPSPYHRSTPPSPFFLTSLEIGTSHVYSVCSLNTHRSKKMKKSKDTVYHFNLMFMGCYVLGNMFTVQTLIRPSCDLKITWFGCI